MAIAAHDQAQVRHAILDQLQPGIAAANGDFPRMIGQRPPLRLRQPQMQAQADRGRGACPPPAVELVLAGGEQRHGRERAGAIALDPDALAYGLERSDLDAAPDRDPPPRCLGQHQLIQPAARQAPGGERQPGGRHRASRPPAGPPRSARRQGWPAADRVRSARRPPR